MTAVASTGRTWKMHTLGPDAHLKKSPAVAQTTYTLPTLSESYQGFIATGLVRKAAVQATSREAKMMLRELSLKYKATHSCFVLVPFFCFRQALANL